MTQHRDLTGKRVLFAGPRFFGYDQDIVAALRQCGATVVRLYDRPFDTPLMTAVTKLSPTAVARAALPRYRALIAQEAPFDVVLVVNGQTIGSAFLTELRQHSPGATFLLYLWDALENRGSIIPQLGKYDYVSGFDRGDAASYGFAYRPLFFTPLFEVERSAPLFDLSFVGTAHSDRAPIVHAIEQSLPADVSRFWYLFLQAPWVRRYYAARSRAFRRVPAEMFHYHALPKTEIGRIFSQSRTILDIEHPRQRGLTMRTFEALGAGKKLVTTNAQIVEEEFYHPENILVVDRHDVRVKRDFLRTPMAPIMPSVVARYSLAGWLDEILAPLGAGAARRDTIDRAP